MSIAGWLRYFPILAELGRTDKGITLLIRTDEGDKVIPLPLKCISIRKYREQGLESLEVGVPEWLAQKAKLN